MDPHALRASLENQRNAADWSASAREWQDKALHHGSEIVRSAAADFAVYDQESAAKLSRADRVARGLEA